MSVPHSIHRVTKSIRWLTVIVVPPLLALMGWGMFEVTENYRSGDPDVSIWIATFALAMMGGLSVVFIAAVIWAFRGRIVLEGDRMTLRGAFTTTVITPERLDGFRVINSQLYVNLKDRRLPLQIGYVQNRYLIDQWLRQHTADVLGELLAEEDAAITEDVQLGFSETEKEERLAALRRLVRRFNVVAYVAAGTAIVNALFMHHGLVGKISGLTLVLTPLCLMLIALFNRGHVRIDHDDGSRYPQIFTATITSGAVLLLLALVDRGALLDEFRFFELVIITTVLNGLVWSFIDAERLKSIRTRGKVLMWYTLFALVAFPVVWIGPGLYFVNKYLDATPVEWHDSEIIEKEKRSGKVSTYYITVTGWSEQLSKPVEIQVRHAEHQSFEPGQRLRVGVRQGAVGVPWVSDLLAGEQVLPDDHGRE